MKNFDLQMVRAMRNAKGALSKKGKGIIGHVKRYSARQERRQERQVIDRAFVEVDEISDLANIDERQPLPVLLVSAGGDQ